jgi:hypothetical protein
MADKWLKSLAINKRWNCIPFSKYDKVAEGADYFIETFTVFSK